MADFSGIVVGIIVAYMFFGDLTNTLTDKETVTQFSKEWKSNNVSSTSNYIADDVIVYNSKYDTLAVTKNDFIKQVLMSDSIQNLNNEVLLLEKVAEGYLLKMKITNSPHQKYNYILNAKNGKIVSIEYLNRDI